MKLATAKPPRKKTIPKTEREAELDKLRNWEREELRALIRARLDLPLAKRMDFLRKPLPGGGSVL